MKALKLFSLFQVRKAYLPPPDRSVKREIEIADILARRYSGKFNRRISDVITK